MAVSLNVSRNIDDKYVQVDVKRTRTGSHYYKVPKENVDEFCTNYKKQNKKKNIASDITFFGSVMLGCFAASLLTKNLNKIPQTIAMLASGLGAGYLADFAVKKAYKTKDEKMLAQFNAQEIDFKATPKVTDIIK